VTYYILDFMERTLAILDYSRWYCTRDLLLSVKKEIKSKVRIHIHMLNEINNNYYRRKNPNLDRKLDSNLRNLDTDGRGLMQFSY